MNLKSQKAFSLIEVFIVVAIIGLLTWLAVPAFNKVRESARKNEIINNLKSIASAGQQYILENGVSQIDYNSLMPNYLTNINPIAGETYTHLIINTNGELSVTQSNGTTVTFIY